MFKRKRQLKVEDTEISVKNVDGEDYISLTDMIKAKENDNYFVKTWLRNRNTIEFLGVWESINNKNFNWYEFDLIKSQAGLNNFSISVKEWCERTNAIGVKATAGRYGGTYAHKDIAFEFGMWISPTFKLYLIKDYERLKQLESNQYQLEWDMRRTLASATYTIHTDAIKDIIIPKALPWKVNYKYASEADIINLALFSMTAKEWREANPERAERGENIRDSASINELLVLEMLQVQSAELIRDGIDVQTRLETLRQSARQKLAALAKVAPAKALKRLDDTTYLDTGK